MVNRGVPSMRLTIFRATIASTLLVVAAPASATTYFTIAGLPDAGPRYSISFAIPDGAKLGPTTPTTARFNGTPFTYTRPNGTTEFVENGPFDGPTFFTTLDQGGIALLRLDREPVQDMQFRLFGTQLFTGPTTAPVFKLGTFDLSSTPRNGGDPVQPLTYRITISDTAIGALPEPATWAMMLLGFGVVGAALRHRRGKGNATATIA
jgi:hypothetical protein